MISFSCDYAKGVHPDILKAISDANNDAFEGYGIDPYTESAKTKIRNACKSPDADIYFLIGGTQTNSTVIATMLRPFEGVVAVNTGHIGVHEAGAVEYTGHKVLTINEHLGKMDADELRQYLADFHADDNREHMVYPGMVYISHPTEHGTLYTAKELKDIHGICKEYDIPLFIDGARMGYGLMSNNTDVDLECISNNCDAFYIGGTKVGALFGEAVVFPRKNTPKQFYTMTKQHGAMLAKGWLTGLQFDTLFTNDLYYRISRNAIDRAEELKSVLKKHNIEERLLTDTNQQFVVLENSFMQKLQEKVTIGYWEKADDTHTVVRFATSWYTTKEEIEELDQIFDELM